MAASTQGSLSIGDLSAVTRRRWPVALATLLVCVVGSLAVGHVWPVSYRASATVAVLPMPLPGQSTQVDVNMATEQVIVTSQVVAKKAAVIAGEGVTAHQLQKSASIAVPSQSNALEIDVTASSPWAAAREANALASAYLSFRSDQSTRAANDTVAALKARIQVLQQRLDKQLNSRKRADTVQDITNLESEERGIAATVALPGDVVSMAVAPSSPSSPGLALFLAAGLVAGAMLGFAAAMLRERLDRKVRSAARLDRHVPCRVMDSRGETPAASGRRITLVLGAARNSDPSGEPAEVPFIVVPTAGAARTPLVQRLRGSRGAQQVAVTTMTGRDGVAAAVASNALARGVGVVCLADDDLAEVMAIVAELETWSSRADLVVIAEAPSSTSRRFRRPGRVDPEEESDETPAPHSDARQVKIGAKPWRTPGSRR
jgi:capsular polysaccharide biosynthesis protein